MLTYKKDDFDESLEDIMKTVNKIINQNEKKEDEKKEDEEKKMKKI